MAGWTVLERDKAEGTWAVENSALVPIGKPGDLASDESFTDFELEVEWKIAELGNSGIFYRSGAERAPVRDAVEYQLADNARGPSQQYPERRNGAPYGLYAPTADASKPVGEWNVSRIVARGTNIEHWLNGKRVAAFDTASQDFAARVAESKFADLPGYGKRRSGRIVLQSHGNRGVMFRRVRIRELH